jgi:2C-methyl-D-erythritol 2,4-cyclodiphosphate synthase
MIINIDKSAIENILHAFESMQSGAPDQASITIGYQSALMLKEVLENSPAVIQKETQKLEKQNEKMLDALKKLLNVAKNAVPIKFMEELDGVVRDCQDVVNQIEGEHE